MKKTLHDRIAGSSLAIKKEATGATSQLQAQAKLKEKHAATALLQCAHEAAGERCTAAARL